MEGFDEQADCRSAFFRSTRRTCCDQRWRYADRALDGAGVERRAGSTGLQRMGALLVPAGLLPSVRVL